METYQYLNNAFTGILLRYIPLSHVVIIFMYNENTEGKYFKVKVDVDGKAKQVPLQCTKRVNSKGNTHLG